MYWFVLTSILKKILDEYFLDIHQKAPEAVSPSVMEVVPPAPMKENESGNRNVGNITNDD